MKNLENCPPKKKRTCSRSIILLMMEEKSLLPRNVFLKKFCTLFVFSLTFVGVWCKLPVGTEVLPCGLRLPSSFHWLFQQKARENPPSFKNAFANRYEIPARDHSVYVSCLLDVSLRPISRFLAGPSRARTGSVRLFLCSDVTSCVDRYLVRGHNAPVCSSHKTSSA